MAPAPYIAGHGGRWPPSLGGWPLEAGRADAGFADHDPSLGATRPNCGDVRMPAMAHQFIPQISRVPRERV